MGLRALAISADEFDSVCRNTSLASAKASPARFSCAPATKSLLLRRLLEQLRHTITTEKHNYEADEQRNTGEDAFEMAPGFVITVHSLLSYALL